MTFRKPWASPLFPFSWRDLALTAGMFSCAVALCFFLQNAGVIEGFAPPVFVLAVLLISRLTTGYLFGFIATVLGMVCVNFVFTYPYWAFNLSLSGYPLTFFTLLMVSLITSTLTAQAKRQARLLAEEAANIWGVKAEAVLRKDRHTRAQSSLQDAALRKTNVKGAYRVPHPERVRGRRFLLIDDVCTTGSTLSAAADALLEAGAAGVVCAVLAGGSRKRENSEELFP